MPVITDIKKLVAVVYILAAVCSLVVNPQGKPFRPTLKAEQRDRLVVHWRIMWPFLAVGVLVLAGVARSLSSDAGPVQWNEYLPVNIGLGLYVAGLLFYCCLACIDWPKDTRTANYDQVIEGRWLASLQALLRPAPVARKV